MRCLSEGLAIGRDLATRPASSLANTTTIYHTFYASLIDTIVSIDVESEFSVACLATCPTMCDILSGVGRVFTPPITNPHCKGEQLRRIGMFQPPSRCFDGTLRYDSYDRVPMQHTDLA